MSEIVECNPYIQMETIVRQCDELLQKCAEFEKENTYLKFRGAEVVDLNKEYRERLDLAIEGLKFYANGDYSTCEAIGEYQSPMDTEKGKLARETLKKLGV